MAVQRDKFKLPARESGTPLASALSASLVGRIANREPGIVDSIYKTVLLQELVDAKDDIVESAKHFARSTYHAPQNPDHAKGRRYLRRAADTVHRVSKMAMISKDEKKQYQKKRMEAAAGVGSEDRDGTTVLTALERLQRQIVRSQGVPASTRRRGGKRSCRRTARRRCKARQFGDGRLT